MGTPHNYFCKITNDAEEVENATQHLIAIDRHLGISDQRLLTERIRPKVIYSRTSLILTSIT